MSTTAKLGLAQWHQLEAGRCLEMLESSRVGLDAADARRRLDQYGPNQLEEKPGRSPWTILREQLGAVMVLILLAATGLSAALGDYQDAGVILAIVVFFVTLGTLQEFRAEKAIAALKALAVPNVRVRRAGVASELPATELVPGDILLLEAGDLVPADARLLEVHQLKVEEAALTGESAPVRKQIEASGAGETALAERRNMLYMGTHVSYGRSLALVVATGMQTELGRIATLIQDVAPTSTPLQQRLDQVGKTLAILAVAFSGLIFAIGILRHEPWRLMLMSAISVAVAAVPEGLPAVLTITLAFGSQRMLKRHALVRKLTGVETLGSVTVICSDKTGTLTQNRMSVTEIRTLSQKLQPQVQVEAQDKAGLDPDLRLLLLCGLLCNDAELQPEGHDLGDPTELALLRAAAELGLDPAALRQGLPRVLELPFDSERKCMTSVHVLDPDWLPAEIQQALAPLPQGKYLSLTKGAVDGLLALSEHGLDGERLLPLTAEVHQALEAADHELAGQGQRVLGFALRLWPQLPEPAQLESGLTFLGMAGLSDPPRPEAFDSVNTCRRAGIRPIMITGDHPLTARHIAHELGISNDGRVLTGAEFAALDGPGLERALKEVSVYARVAPEHKLRLVEALQRQGQIVAMTGDGVNDAPALKQADIGVAMGLSGTDVAKEAADMVLQDDNFATLVAAVAEGRTIYDNLRKFIKFSVAGNLGKILVMLIAPLLGMPLALQPIQMLWLNLLTDGLLGFGLGLEAPERKIMERPPVPPDESIIGGRFMFQVSWMGLLIGGLSIGLAGWYFFQDPQGPWQSVLFTSLACAQIYQALAIRSSQDSLRITGFSNPVLWGMIAAVLLLQLAVLYLPWLNTLFHAQPLAASTLLQIAALNSLILLLAEGLKFSGRKV
ncbi:MAG TPA: cation-translocating P-type ATPase [Candidatus Obscuribacterales bacterium]